MKKISKILVLVFILGGMLVFSLPGRIFQGAAQEKLPIFVKEEPSEKIVRPLYVPDEIIVKFKSGVKKEDIENFNRQKGVEEKYESPYAHFKVLRIPPSKTVEEMVEIYKKNPNIEYAEPNYYAYATMVPDDPGYQYQWHFDNATYGGIQMEQAWDIITGTSSVIVAVLDTGVAYEDYRGFEQAPDLADTSFISGHDFINNDSHPNDDDGHGTHVTGTIAQTTNNSLGVAGIAFNTSIIPVKVLDQSGIGTTETVADGIYFAVDNGADIINLSLGWPIGINPGLILEDAVIYAYSQGVTIVAASGNDADKVWYIGGISYPAAYDDYVIAVGATRYDEDVAYYSNYSSSLDLTAPGGDVTIDQNGDGYGDGVLQQTFDTNPKDFGYWFYQGTSMSAPHVSGVAALLLAQDPNRTPDQIRNILQTTAEDKGATGWDQYYGWGIIDAYAALTYAPAVSISLTTDGSVEFGVVSLGVMVDSSGDVQIVSVDTGPANLDVKSTVFSDNGNNWSLGSTNGANQVVWRFSEDGTTWPLENIFTTPGALYDLTDNVLEGGTQDLYLRLTMPTDTASTNQYSSTVTIVATVP